MTERKVELKVFFQIWADIQRWDVPDFHFTVCDFLQDDWHDGLLMMPRGHAKSSIIAVYNAWKYYHTDGKYRILHQGDQDSTAYKMSRDTLAIISKHPLCRKIIKTKGEVQEWWVSGSVDERNPSMQARGITSNVTSSRADEVQNDDVEVPRNIQTADAREKLRYRLGEQTHILVPGGRTLYVGTPHTHKSLYEDVKTNSRCLILKAFQQEHRIENKDHATLSFKPEYVYSGIGKYARLLEPGIDYTLTNMGDRWEVMLATAAVIADFYAGALWPERFTPAEMGKRRQKCKTMNEWDSQYQLHAKPVIEVRIDPDRMGRYTDEPEMRFANNSHVLEIGGVQMVGCSFTVDPSSGKLNSDVSAGALIFQDGNGKRYWHRALTFTGDVATFADDGKTITGGQVFQICDVVKEFSIPRVTIKTAGIGGFMPAVMKAALKQRRLICGVTEEKETTNKNKRIVEAFEPLLLSGMIDCHESVVGIVEDQMREFNPLTTSNEDDYIDAASSAITQSPERIQSVGKYKKSDAMTGNNWQPISGTFEAGVDF